MDEKVFENSGFIIMKKIYVGCALTQAPEEFRNAIESFKLTLREEYEVLDFVDLSVQEVTFQHIFDWDTNCVKTCDLFIADCTYPAIGLGYELGVALESKKKVLAIAEEDAKISRLVLGVTSPKFEFMRYKDIKEIIPKIKELL